MTRFDQKTLVKAALVTAGSMLASLAIVLTIVFARGDELEAVDVWVSLLCPLLIAFPLSTWLIDQKVQIDRAHKALDRAHSELRELHEVLSVRALTDCLTGGLNRGAFIEQMETACRQRSGETIAMLIADVDHFKRVNDNFGHHVGDQALCAIATVFGEKIGKDNLWGRMGGEEFGLLLRNVNEAKALAIAEAIRHAVSQINLEHEGQSVPLSISIGCCLAQTPCAITEVYRCADTSLYEAKSGGRDRVSIHHGRLLSPSPVMTPDIRAASALGVRAG